MSATENLGLPAGSTEEPGLPDRRVRRKRAEVWESPPWGWASVQALTVSRSHSSPIGGFLSFLGLHHCPFLSLLPSLAPTSFHSLSLFISPYTHLVELPTLPAPTHQCLHIAAHQEGGEDEEDEGCSEEEAEVGPPGEGRRVGVEARETLCPHPHARPASWLQSRALWGEKLRGLCHLGPELEMLTVPTPSIPILNVTGPWQPRGKGNCFAQRDRTAAP